MQQERERISKTRGIYFLRLIGRIVVFFIAILIYIFDKEKFNIADGWNFFNEFSLLHLLWIIWRDYFTSIILSFSIIPLLKWSNAAWFDILVGSLAGKVLIVLMLIMTVISAFITLKINKPL